MNFRHAFIILSVGCVLPAGACTSESGGVDQTEEEQIALAVSDARMVLPPVSGNPAAVYFDITNSGSRNYVVRAVSIAGAGYSELHGSMEMDGKMMMDSVGQILVSSGSTEKLEPGGFHVMAFDLDPALAPGGSTEMTLTIVGGQTMTFPIDIRSAGDDR